MRILVIGGSGMIGYYLLPLLVTEGHDVVVMSRGNRSIIAEGVTHVKADRRFMEDASAAVTGNFDVIIDNVAYDSSHAESLCDAFKGRFHHYVVTSTAFVYEGIESASARPSRPFREEDAVFAKPVSDEAGHSLHDQYVFHKRRLEYWLRRVASGYGVNVTVIRPLLQIVGPNTEDARFAWFWLRVTDGGSVWLPEDARLHAGPCQLAFSGDVAKAIAKAVTHPPSGAYAVYNVGQPELWTYEEYIHAMARAAGTTADICYAPREMLNQSPFALNGVYRLPLPYRVAFDVRAAELALELNWTPMDQWIEETGDWMSQFYKDAAPEWYALRPLEREWSLK